MLSMWIPDRLGSEDENPFVDHGTEADFYSSGVSGWMEPGDYKRRIGFHMEPGEPDVEFTDPSWVL